MYAKRHDAVYTARRKDMAYFCGWDGGGTKTEVCCVDEHGAFIGGGRFGPLNMNGLARARVADTVRDCMAFMAKQPGGLNCCAALTIGMAGASNREASALIEEAVRAGGYAGRLEVVGDQQIALAGAVHGAGAVLIAGTGAVCCGRDDSGREVRVGGYGYLIDDGGSGYALGRDILSAVVRAEDGRISPTLLSGMVYEQLNVHDIRQIITWLYSPDTGKRDVAALAPLLKKALDAGDAAAISIAGRAAHDLAELAVTAWRRLGLNAGELALTGSILEHYPTIRAQVEAICAQNCAGVNIIPPRGTPAQGAAAMARASAGIFA